MERALTWLPLLGIFLWLAWAGWNEYQKVQTYQAWATGFERSKYDIRAVLGQNGPILTWGRPSRRGPINMTSISLANIEAIELQVGGHAVEPSTFVKRGEPIELVLASGQGDSYRIPFIEFPMASQWEKALQDSLQTLKSAST